MSTDFKRIEHLRGKYSMYCYEIDVNRDNMHRNLRYRIC
jgi:hypothetical protein